MEIILARLSGIHVESGPRSKISDSAVQSVRASSTHIISGNAGSNTSRMPALYGQAAHGSPAYGQATYGRAHGQVSSNGYSVSNSNNKNSNSSISSNGYGNSSNIGESNSDYGDSSRIKCGMGGEGTGQGPGSRIGPGSGSGALITEDEIQRLTHTRY
jgi:hypothetical protein